MARQAKHLRKTVVAALLCGLGALSAQAATLERQQILSKPGEPLRLDIPVAHVSPSESDDLRVSLASRQAFAQAGVTYSPALDDIHLTLEKIRDDRYVIHVTSAKPMDTPFVDALLVLKWRAGQQSFVYTMLTQADDSTARASTSVIPPSAAPSKVAPPTESTTPASQASNAPASSSATPGNYVVRKGDTLSQLASRYASEDAQVSAEQMMMALYQANRSAFIDGDPNRVKAGATLTIPGAADAQAVTRPAARRFAVQTHEQFQAYRARLAEGVAQQHVADRAGRRAGGAIGQATPPQAVPEAQHDELKLSRAERGGKAAGDEENIAQGKALAESQARVKALEKNVADLQKLLAMKNQALADLQHNGGASQAAAAGAPASQAQAAGTPAPIAQPGAAASAPQGASAAAATPTAATPWEKLREQPYGWGILALVAIALAGWLARRNRRSAPAPVGQDGPYDSGPDTPMGATSEAHADERHDPSITLPAAGGAAAYAAQALASHDDDDHARDNLPADAASAPAAHSVADMTRGIDLSLPGVPEGTGTLRDPVADDEAEQRPWALAKARKTPQDTSHDGHEAQDAAAMTGDVDDASGLPAAVADAHGATPLKPLAFDLSGFNLDLPGGDAPGHGATAPHVSDVADAAQGAGSTLSDIDTKLELASAYVAIGDQKGARELLEEVLKEGDAHAQSVARERLAALG